MSPQRAGSTARSLGEVAQGVGQVVVTAPILKACWEV